jgi:hypothetical protein
MRLCLWIISVVGSCACYDERNLISPEGRLEFDIVGRFVILEKQKSFQGPIQHVVVDIDRKDGKYVGAIDRKIAHLQRDKTILIHYRGRLHGARHSWNEITFRDEIEISCSYELKDNVTKPMADLILSDFEKPTCRSKENLDNYHEREGFEKFGSIYFAVKSNSEIWWTPSEYSSGLKLLRQPILQNSKKDSMEKIFP